MAYKSAAATLCCQTNMDSNLEDAFCQFVDSITTTTLYRPILLGKKILASVIAAADGMSGSKEKYPCS